MTTKLMVENVGVSRKLDSGSRVMVDCWTNAALTAKERILAFFQGRRSPRHVMFTADHYFPGGQGGEMGCLTVVQELGVNSEPSRIISHEISTVPKFVAALVGKDFMTGDEAAAVELVTPRKASVVSTAQSGLTDLGQSAARVLPAESET